MNIGYEIKDLHETDLSLFTEDADCWEIVNPEPEDFRVTKKIENSTEPKLILFMNNTLNDLANTPTQSFYLKAEYFTRTPHKYAIGSLKLWYSDDDFSDGSTLTLEIFVTSNFPETMGKLEKPCFTMKIPGPQKQIQPNFEYIYFGEIQDSMFLSFVVKVQVHYNDSEKAKKSKSLALRDLKFHLHKELLNVTHPQADQGCAANCDSCFGTKPSQCLSCSAGSHWHGFGCISCHINCEKCTGSTQHECSSCNFGFYNYGNGTCLETCKWPFHPVKRGSERMCLKACKSDEYAYRYHRTCLASCNAPFFPSTDENGILTCEATCSNQSGFLFMNGSCLSVCPAPLMVESYIGLKICKNPCNSASKFLYGDQSCNKECPAPLKVRYESIANYCENPCGSEDDYLLNNGSCLSDCPTPLVSEIKHGVKFCKNPCKLMSDYLFVNGSCGKECPAPLEVRFEPGVRYCENLCHSENLFLVKNGSCLSTCPAPLIAVSDDIGRYCINPCRMTSDYVYFNRSCMKECPAPLKIRTEPIANFCINPCQSENSYLYQNGSCFPACKAPLVAVFELGVKYCRNPCQSRTDYLYANRSCFKECPTPLMVKHEPIASFCVNPCLSMKLYLYHNGSCLPSCLFPRKIKEEFGVKYCESRCNLTREYILKDGSCSSECPPPLIQRKDESLGTLCLNPCESDDHFILHHKNGSSLCLQNCPDYFETKIEYGVKFCLRPCLADQYYFEKNKSCVNMCSHPFKIIQEEGIRLCQNPCSNSNAFIYHDQSCHKSCPHPLIIEEGNYCKSPCFEDSQYVNTHGDCQEGCEYPYKIIKKGPYKICQLGKSAQISAMRETIKISNNLIEIGGVLSCLISTGNPTSILMVPLLDMFRKIILIENKLPDNPELLIFGERKLSSEFDERVVILAILSGMALLISGLIKITGSNFYQLLVKCDFALRWNTLIPLFLSVYGDLLLNSLIESNYPRGILCLLLTILLFSQIYRVSKRRREEDIPRWRFLFDVFEANQRFFILIYFARVIVYHLIVGLLFDFPHLQAFSVMLLSFGMCFYLILVSPFSEILSKIQCFIVEFALLFYNFIFGSLAIFELTESSVVGQLMNILYLITSVITAMMTILKIIQTVYSQYKSEILSGASQINQIQLSEINQESDLDSPPTSIRFEPLNQIERAPEDSEEDSIEPSIAVE